MLSVKFYAIICRSANDKLPLADSRGDFY